MNVLRSWRGPWITAGYHGATVNIAAANEPLRWRDIWPTVCASMKCDPIETILEHQAIPSVDSVEYLVRMNKDDWNRAFTNDWKRLQPRKYPWPSLSEEKFAAFWMEERMSTPSWKSKARGLLYDQQHRCWSCRPFTDCCWWRISPWC